MGICEHARDGEQSGRENGDETVLLMRMMRLMRGDARHGQSSGEAFCCVTYGVYVFRVYGLGLRAGDVHNAPDVADVTWKRRVCI